MPSIGASKNERKPSTLDTLRYGFRVFVWSTRLTFSERAGAEWDEQYNDHTIVSLVSCFSLSDFCIGITIDVI